VKVSEMMQDRDTVAMED